MESSSQIFIINFQFTGNGLANLSCIINVSYLKHIQLDIDLTKPKLLRLRGFEELDIEIISETNLQDLTSVFMETDLVTSIA